MPGYKAPVDDVMFLLNDVFKFEKYNNLPASPTPRRTWSRRSSARARSSARRC
jgi:hypothetical protein